MGDPITVPYERNLGERTAPFRHGPGRCRLPGGFCMLVGRDVGERERVPRTSSARR